MDNQLDTNVQEAAEKKEKAPVNKIQLCVLIFVILTFVATSSILAIHISKDNVFGGKSNTEIAETQGNLGNYNVECVKNTLVQKLDGSYELTVQIDFTNYAGTGTSFDDAVSVVAYQNDKEVPLVYTYDLEEIDIAAEEQRPDNESSLKVRNGSSSKVVLTYQLAASDRNVSIEMESDTNTYTYTVNLEG